MNKIYGIDLGTTYSCISYYNEFGQQVVINNAEGSATTPSVVFFESADNSVVGQTAKDAAPAHSDRVVETVKRAMGDEEWRFPAFGQDYRPEEVSALILKKLVNDARLETGEDITDVVITCPAYFGNVQRQATKQAGEIAGLTVHYIITEPTAAAIAYGMDLGEDKNVLVYDLGGGTFDVTIIAIEGEEIREVAIGGDDRLGGKNWDNAIVQYLVAEFEEQKGQPAEALLDDPETFRELMLSAERAKIALSSRMETETPVLFDIVRARIKLTREKFEEITADLLARTIEYTKQVMERGREKGVDRIDTVLLVGGSTTMPQVSERLEAEFPDIEIKRQDPHLIVAKGAAIYGFKHQLDSELEDVKAQITADGSVDAEAANEQALDEMSDRYGMPKDSLAAITAKKIETVTSKSFGVIFTDDATRQDYVVNLIEVDDRLPIKVHQDAQTLDDDQGRVTIRVVENRQKVKGGGHRVDVGDCRQLGEAELIFEHALPKDSPLRVTFNISTDGLLKMTGEDLTTHRDVRAEFRTDSVMSEEDVQQARSRQSGMTVS